MKESSKMTCRKVKEWRNGQMEVSSLGTSPMERKKGMVFSSLQMGLFTKAVFIKEKWRAKEKRLMLMDPCMKGNSRTTEKMEKAFVTGQMEGTTKETLCQASEMDLVSTNGLTAESTQELGRMANKTAEANLRQEKTT